MVDFIINNWISIATAVSLIAGVLYLLQELWHSKKKLQEFFDGRKKPTILIDSELPEGQVALDSLFYVERPPIEEDCFKAVLKFDALIRVKAPRQMGKTSLMARILDHAKKHEHRTVFLSFQEADSDVFVNLDSFLRWFCASIAMQLNLEDKIEEKWKKLLGSKNNCSNYFRDYLLSDVSTPLTLGLDEIDQVFKYPTIMQDFFGLLRAWHERGKNDETWKKLRLIIVHSQEVYVPLDINQSPFNVGLPINLPELTEAQAMDLATRHQLSWSKETLEKLMTLVGGHPYLLRVAFHHISQGRITLDELIETAPTDEGLYFEHLHRHLLNLEEANLKEVMQQIVTADNPIEGVDSAKAFKLRSMGLVKFKKNSVSPSCHLYRQYFHAKL